MDLLNLSTSTNEIIKFLNESDTQLLVVVGMSKSGKTKTVIDALNATKTFYNTPSYNDMKEFDEGLDNFLNSKGISMLFCETKKAVFLDDIDIIFSLFKNAKSCCVRYMEQHPTVKFIMTCPPAEEKRLHDVKKIKRVTIRLNKVEDTENNQYRDRSLYELTYNLFKNSDKGMLDLKHALSSDALMIAYMLYDNALLCVSKENISKVYKIYCEMSIIEDYAFKLNEWGIVDWYTLVECGWIRHLTEFKKHKVKEDDIVFTQIPCRSSQRYCVLKKRFNLLLTDCKSLELSNTEHEINYRLKKQKFNFRTDDGAVINSYVSNITYKQERAKKTKTQKI
jgi:hypothetical protein